MITTIPTMATAMTMIKLIIRNMIMTMTVIMAMTVSVTMTVVMLMTTSVTVTSYSLAPCPLEGDRPSFCINSNMAPVADSTLVGKGWNGVGAPQALPWGAPKARLGIRRADRRNAPFGRAKSKARG